MELSNSAKLMKRLLRSRDVLVDPRIAEYYDMHRRYSGRYLE
jgi:hypothetical protein